MEERRRHQRYSVIHEMGFPIQLSIENNIVPGVLVDLSAGGMALLAYTNLPFGTQISLTISLPGLSTKALKGKVVWAIPKAEMWRLGISFTTIDSADFRLINKMAFEYNDCDLKYSLGVNDVCTVECMYYPLCQKPIKKTNKK